MPATTDSKFVTELNDKNFSIHIAKGVVLVDFWAPWCMPCKMIAPVLNELAEENVDTFKVGKLNVDENQQTAQKYGVRSIPTLIIFKNGKEAERIVGVKNKAYIKQRVENQQK